MRIFKDKEFCRSDCTNKECHMYLSDEVLKESKKSGYFLATSNYSTFCDKYKKDHE